MARKKRKKIRWFRTIEEKERYVLHKALTGGVSWDAGADASAIMFGPPVSSSVNHESDTSLKPLYGTKEYFENTKQDSNDLSNTIQFDDVLDDIDAASVRKAWDKNKKKNLSELVAMFSGQSSHFSAIEDAAVAIRSTLHDSIEVNINLLARHLADVYELRFMEHALRNSDLSAESQKQVLSNYIQSKWGPKSIVNLTQTQGGHSTKVEGGSTGKRVRNDEPSTERRKLQLPSALPINPFGNI